MAGSSFKLEQHTCDLKIASFELMEWNTFITFNNYPQAAFELQMLRWACSAEQILAVLVSSQWHRVGV